jgi:hypothetical protein
MSEEESSAALPVEQDPATKAPLPQERVVPSAKGNPQYDDIAHVQESAREHFGWGIFILLVTVLFLDVVLDIRWHDAYKDLGELLKTVLTSLLTLLAAVVGYYYGSRKP